MTKLTTEKENGGAMHLQGLSLQFKEAEKGVSIPDTIHLIPVGQWEHDAYGPILINASDIREFAQNYNAGIRNGVFITAGHEGFQELPAVGWITKVECRDDGLWGDVEWSKAGKELLSDKAFKFFSPEFYRDYEDPQTHQLYRNVMTGGALTKSPYFKELEAIVFSEKVIIKSKFNENNMNLKDLVAKDITTLSDEEKAFIIEHKEELSAEEKTALTSIIDVEEKKEETDEEKTVREEKEKGDANEAAGLNRDGSAKVEEPKAPTEDEIKASEKVTISAIELTMLRSQANLGAQAFAENKKNKINGLVTGMVFSEANKNGKFLPKSSDNLRSFMETLNDAQSAKFSELIAALPSKNVFGELGSKEVVAGTAAAELNAKVDAKMKANDKLQYSEALKQVLSENEGLEQRFDEELVPVRNAKK